MTDGDVDSVIADPRMLNVDSSIIQHVLDFQRLELLNIRNLWWLIYCLDHRSRRVFIDKTLKKTRISTRENSDKDNLSDYEMNMNSISDQAVTREDHRSANWRVVKQ